MKKKVYLTLQNGKVFEGYRFGADGDVTGELVFSTGGVDNCLVELTDPAYCGQILLHTFPLVGNYGVVPAEFESDRPWASAYVVREICETPSNFRSEGKVGDYLKEKGVVGVYGVDTRELTKILRDNGTMNAYIGDAPLTDTSVLGAYAVKDAVAKTSAQKVTEYGDKDAKWTVAYYDFGAKNSDVEEIVALGAKVFRVPASTTAEEVLALGVDGVVLGAGPGDPAKNVEIVAEIQKLVGKKPIFGIALGYQMLALALGAKTAKMKKGHRGGQPVKYLDTGRVYISSQNHGYEVLASSVVGGKVDFINVNDGTVEGIDYLEKQAFGVQFDPASCSIASPSNVLYDKFIAMMQKEKANA